MCANIVRCVDVAIDVVQCDFLSADSHLFRVVGVDIGCIGHLVPGFFAHGFVILKSAQLSDPGPFSVAGRSKIDF